MTTAAEAAVATGRALLERAGVTPDTVADEALALCAIPAPTFAEAARRDEVARRLGAGVVDDAGNLVVRAGPRAGAPAVLAAHLDTVFPAGTPLRPSRDGDVLHGPGIGDNTLAVAALMGLVRALRRGEDPRLPIVVAFTTGEEGAGNLVGATALVRGLGPRAFVAVEGHFLDRLAFRAVGSTRLRADFATAGGHSWGDRGSPSAVHAAMRAGALVAGIAPGSEASVSIGVVEGGTGVNVIADRASMLVDIRAVDAPVLADLEQAVRAALKAGAQAEGARLEVADIGRRPGGRTDPGHPLARSLVAVRAAVGLPEGDAEAVSTDANAAIAAGVPAATIGVSRGSGMHTPDERVEVAPLALGLAQLAGAAVLLGGHPSG